MQPAVKHGIFELWVDREMMGGADWEPEIERKLRACDIFILLVSANSMASDYIVDKEIRDHSRAAGARGRRPLLSTAADAHSDAGLNKVKDKNLRPRDAKPFSSFSYHDRLQHMKEAADEIAKIAGESVARKRASAPAAPAAQPATSTSAASPKPPTNASSAATRS